MPSARAHVWPGLRSICRSPTTPHSPSRSPTRSASPCLSLAQYCLSRGGTAACTVNAANEIAVAAFLAGRIHFGDIYNVIADTLAAMPFVSTPSYDDYVAVNKEARARATALINAINV